MTFEEHFKSLIANLNNRFPQLVNKYNLILIKMMLNMMFQRLKKQDVFLGYMMKKEIKQKHLLNHLKKV